jgi:predicted enzyme related to lactoylglutathione lyase
MARKKIDPLNRKQYSAVSAALTVSNIPAAMSFYQKAFGFSSRCLKIVEKFRASHRG